MGKLRSKKKTEQPVVKEAPVSKVLSIKEKLEQKKLEEKNV